MNKKIIVSSLLPLIGGSIMADNVKPNILFFIVDDMGWQDTSLPFWTERTATNDMYETPNMERLAQMGMKFTNAYASSISSPTRCSLLSGVNQATHRVTNWTLNYNSSTDGSNSVVSLPQWNVNGVQPTTGIPRSFAMTPLAQLLSNGGYHTIHCGKAHWGSKTTPGENPLNLGFDVNITGSASGGLASYLGTDRFGHDKNGNRTSAFSIEGLEDYWDKDIFVTEALTQEALKALKKREGSDQPFFLYMSHYAIHTPIMADNRFYDKYVQKGCNRAAYASMIEGMDKSLGDLINYLQSTDELKNTIVIFYSDNGGLGQNNYPLRGGKGCVYEGGVREPLIVYWNGVTTPNSVTDKYVISEDFFPTVLEMAGVVNYQTIQQVEGVSFVPILDGSGDPSANRPIYWNTPNQWQADNTTTGVGQTCAMRLGDWKVVYWYRYQRAELYNLKNDIREETDLAASNPDKLAEMTKKLSDYLRSVNAQRPTFKDTGKPCPWPDGKE